MPITRSAPASATTLRKANKLTRAKQTNGKASGSNNSRFYAARPDNAVERKTFGTWLFRQVAPNPRSIRPAGSIRQDCCVAPNVSHLNPASQSSFQGRRCRALGRRDRNQRLLSGGPQGERPDDLRGWRLVTTENPVEQRAVDALPSRPGRLPACLFNLRRSSRTTSLSSSIRKPPVVYIFQTGLEAGRQLQCRSEAANKHDVGRCGGRLSYSQGDR